jgi:hypothetical protein
VTSTEAKIENDLIAKLQELKYEYRPDGFDGTAMQALRG